MKHLANIFYKKAKELSYEDFVTFFDNRIDIEDKKNNPKAEDKVSEIIAIEKGTSESSTYFRVGKQSVVKIIEEFKNISYEFDSIKEQLLIYIVYFENGSFIQIEANSELMVSYV